MIALSATVLSSCLKDEEEIFEEPANIRVQQVLDNTKKVLTSSPEGWAFEYYPDREISYGGYIYTCQFTEDQKVTVGSELAPGDFETSLYKLTNDNGPVLSFDTYNTLMHYFATPWGGSGFGYEAYDGDFQFMIMDVTDDVIKLRGTRTGNTMYMRRLAQDADSFIKGASEMADNLFLTSATGTVGGSNATAAIDLDSRYMDITIGDQTAGNYFTCMPGGIRFLEPVEINGAEIETLMFNADTMTFTGTDSKGNSISLAGSLPEGYMFFDDFAGEYTVNFNSTRHLNVTFTPDKDHNCYVTSGWNRAGNFTVTFNYSKTNGCLEVNSQAVGAQGSNVVWLCMWDKVSGNLTWSTDCGLYMVPSDSSKKDFVFVNNNKYDLEPNSFILWMLNASGASAGEAASPWVFNYYNGTSTTLYQSTRFSSIIGLTKN